PPAQPRWRSPAKGRAAVPTPAKFVEPGERPSPGMAPRACFVNCAVRRAGSDQSFGGSARRQGHPIAGVALGAAVELELHEGALDLGGARLALPDQLVNQERLGSEPLAQPADQVGGAVGLGFVW